MSDTYTKAEKATQVAGEVAMNGYSTFTTLIQCLAGCRHYKRHKAADKIVEALVALRESELHDVAASVASIEGQDE